MSCTTGPVWLLLTYSFVTAIQGAYKPANGHDAYVYFRTISPRYPGSEVEDGAVRYPPDEFSRHEYEVKNVFMERGSFKAVVFYLRYHDEVEIDIEGVLKNTGLWNDPEESETQRTYHMLFEVAPRNGDAGTVDLYVSRFVAEHRKDS